MKKYQPCTLEIRSGYHNNKESERIIWCLCKGLPVCNAAAATEPRVVAMVTQTTAFHASFSHTQSVTIWEMRLCLCVITSSRDIHVCLCFIVCCVPLLMFRLYKAKRLVFIFSLILFDHAFVPAVTIKLLFVLLYHIPTHKRLNVCLRVTLFHRLLRSAFKVQTAQSQKVGLYLFPYFI